MIDEYVKLISCFHQINFCGGKDKTIFQNATSLRLQKYGFYFILPNKQTCFLLFFSHIYSNS